MFYSCFWLSALFLISSKIVAQYVETIAGSGVEGFMDGRSSEARFKLSIGVEVDSTGNIYVCDTLNHRIRKISPLGDVTTLAGNGQADFADGPAQSAAFDSPMGIVLDSAGNLYISDPGNQRIRKISASGQVTTLCGSGTAGFADGNCTTARFNAPRGIALDSSGNIYVADALNNRIRKVFPNATVTSIAGSATAGFLDGSASTSQLKGPRGVAVDSQGIVYVADTNNYRIRKIMSAVVSTLAGSGSVGGYDGRGSSATFSGPYNIKVDSNGALYVTDFHTVYELAKIRRVTMDGDVTTVFGKYAGLADGLVSKAQVNSPTGISLDTFGNIYFNDQNIHRIRKFIFPSNIADNILAYPKPSIVTVSTNGTGDIVAHAIDNNGIQIIGISSSNSFIQLLDPAKTLIYEARRTLSSSSSNRTWGALVKLTPNNNVGWAQCIDGSGESVINDIATSGSGDVYVVGSHTGTISFSNQTQNLTAATLQATGSTQNGFITKYASTGTFLWAASIRGSPLYLTVETWDDSPIVTVKFAKQIANDTLSCTIIPTIGESLRLSAIHYGMAVIRLSPEGGILWSRVLNFAPWERNQTLSVSRFGDISLTGWCFLTCQLYVGNETTSKYTFPSPNSGSNAVNVVLSMNGMLQSWSPLSKYIPIRASNNQLSCGMGVKNTTGKFLSFGNQTLIELKESATLNLVAVNDILFLSVNKEQRLVIKLNDLSEFLFDLDSAAVAWTSCGRFDSLLGPQNIRGNLQNGTIMFGMDSQLGYLSKFPFPSNLSYDTLVRFRPVGRFSFQCGLYNGSHAYFVSIRSGILEASLASVSSDNSFWDEGIVQHNLNVGDVSSSVIAFVIISDQVTFFLNGNRLFDFNFVSTSKFLFTTIDSQGSVDMMGIMALPQPLEPWLINPDSIGVTDGSSLTFSHEMSSVEVATQVQSNPTSTNKTNSRTVWSLFGLSGTLLYIVLGATGFLVLILVAVIASFVIIVTKRRRRLKEGLQNTAITFTADITNATGHDAYQNTANQTLVNTYVSSGLNEQKTR